ncbi:MAG: hypothetical protein LBH92_00730 [Bacteroidales bacterium]|jgi:hypothetical protein|nr:hypothetical protein [Bacteroidales bacterium]
MMKKNFVSDVEANNSSQTIAEIVNVSGMESRDHLSNGISSNNQKSRSSVLSLLGIAMALVFIFGACNKNDLQSIQKTTQNKMIPIAKLTDKNEIEHLFLQKDAQEIFSKENPNAKLVFIEVVDYEKDGSTAGLLYRIYYEESNVSETSIISVITLIGDTYYYAVPGGGISIPKVICTTTDCSDSSTGCQPQSDGSCSKCDLLGLGKCTRTSTSVTSKSLSGLTNAIQDIVSIN